MNRPIAFFVFWAAILCAGSASAQHVHAKQIYLWDVTGSMKTNGIWEDVKDHMIESLKEIRDKDTEVIIIPFQDGTHDEEIRRVRIGDEAALDQVCAWIKGKSIPHNHDVTNSNGKRTHGTNICRALERAQDFVIKEDIDCVFLMTDGDHSPEDPRMVSQYPASCVSEIIRNQWCTYATEYDAYLVYYHLIGNSNPEIEKVTKESCRVLSIEPDGNTPDRLHYITPQVKTIVKDRSFLDERTASIPVTSSLPAEFEELCLFVAELSNGSAVFELGVEFTGSTLACTLSEKDAATLAQICPATADAIYDLEIGLTLIAPDDIMVVLTAESIPLEFHHYEQRWFDLKVVAKSEE